MTPSSSAAISDELLINQAYYHGFKTEEEAELLIPNKNGAFLVRLVQENYKFIYMVSVYWEKEKHHYKIRQTSHKHFYYLNGEPKRSVHSLIRFHRLTQWPINAGSSARLRTIVERSHYTLYREQLKFGAEILGQGEYGEVHKGKLRLGSFTVVDVAVKIDLNEVSAHERLQFLHEANLMMRLRHRNVVRLYGVVVYDDPILIVTEFANGGCLLAKLMSFEQFLDADERLNFCQDICFGMAYLERKCVIHRDLSAKNLLLNKDGCVKIADFGLSKCVKGHGSIEIRKENAPMRFVPPETLTSAIFSHKTDVWAFGCTLFEIWSQPYEEPYSEIQTNRELKKRILEGHRLQPPAGMPPKMAELMRQCHGTEPEHRPSFAQIKQRHFGQEPGLDLLDRIGRFAGTLMHFLSF